MQSGKFWTVLAAAVAGVVLLAGCRAEEQGRVVRYKPGVYLGKKDSHLDEVMEQALRDRALFQAERGSAGAAGGRPSDVNPPK